MSQSQTFCEAIYVFFFFFLYFFLVSVGWGGAGRQKQTFSLIEWSIQKKMSNSSKMYKCCLESKHI